MELQVIRKISKTETIGRLTLDGKHIMDTLEDPKGPTLIPDGRYEVLLTYSARFGRVMPLISNVPKFSGVRIHPGNTTLDTTGCLLVGRRTFRRTLEHSRAAFDVLFALLERTSKKEKIFITYVTASNAA
jgi:hypothetical protein